MADRNRYQTAGRCKFYRIGKKLIMICRRINILGKGGGYVLNSVHNIQPAVPPENVVAMFDEGRKHRYAKAS